MLQKVIKFKDHDGNEREITCHFNLMKSELMELELTTSGGLTQAITDIVAANDSAKIISLFKKIILLAYGERDPDGIHFNKSEAISTRFSQSLAYSTLFMELATNAEAAAAFINAIVPQNKE